MNARKLILAALAGLCVSISGMALGGVPALATPTIPSEEVSEVTDTSATLNDVIDPGGKATSYQFEYGTVPPVIEQEAFGSVVPASPTLVGSDFQNHTVSAVLSGLTRGTTYYYRVVLTGGFGVLNGPLLHFKTSVLPTAKTGDASSVTETSATITGTVDPEGAAATYQFEYADSIERLFTPGMASLSPASPASVGSDSTTHPLSADLAGLTPGTIYLYRIAATNAEGTSYGGVKEFHTQGPPALAEELATDVTHASAVIKAEANPNGLDTHMLVEYGTTAGYGSSSASVDIGSGDVNQSASIELTGLQIGTTYHYRVVLSNSSGPPVDGPDETFTTLSPSKIEGESFSEVGSASVAVNAKINDFGVDSSYYYEYGTSESYGSTTPIASFGNANGDVPAPAVINGLQPDTVYHFRVVVTNELGTVDGADVAFSTLSVALQGLPDGRVYEMVTPSRNDNADVDFPRDQAGDLFGRDGKWTYNPFQAAVGGGAVAYVADPTIGGNGDEGGTEGNQYLATRSPQGGWTQVNIQPSGYKTPRYFGFSSGLSVGVLQSHDPEFPPLAPGAPGEGYKVLYARTSDGGYHALFTETPPNRTPGEFKTAGQTNGLEYMGGSSDFGHVLFEANDALTPEADAQPPTSSENDLYDSAGGQLHLVNVLPDGAVVPNATFGGPGGDLYKGASGAALGHAISGDGSRIFWTDLSTGDLYVRENDTQPPSPVDGQGRCIVPADACTVQVDASQNPAVEGGGGLFWTASSDGSKVFFTDCHRLTEDSTATEKGCDLYEYDVTSGALSDLTVDHNASDALGADVLGVLGAGEDGEYVYFVATGSLATGATGGEPNLYVAHDGVVKFITLLSYADNHMGADDGLGTTIFGVWQPSLATRTAEVAPDGRSLVFSTEIKRSERDPERGGGVFVYSVESEHLVCVSCSPSVDVASSVSEPLVTGASGGFLPVEEENIAYQSRWISADGSRVFFDSDQPLLARDVNGAQDVYEWERDGSGSCRESPGCVYLISSGTSSSSSAFLDASVSGGDVFIITRSELVREDENENFNVFDARVGGVLPLAPAACSGTGCQGIPSAPPVFATPSSQTYNGVGNFSVSVGPAVKAKPKAKAKKGKPKRGRAKRGKKGKGRRASVRDKARGAVRRGVVGDLGRSGR